MNSKKGIIILFILFFNIIASFFSVNLGFGLGGLFVGSILAMGLFFIEKKYFIIIDKIFMLLLIFNLIILFVNLFFYNYLIIPPIFSSPDETYKKSIIRAINIFGTTFRMRRATGLSDNIHVSSLLNIILCYILYVNNKKIFFYISTFILFFSLNVQFVLIFLMWMLIRSKQIKFSFKTFGFLFIFLILFFYLLDYLILGSAYYYQILASGSNILLNDFKYYLSIQTFRTLLFGIKPSFLEDPYDRTLGYYIPLTDIGIIGIPIQFGIVGLTSIILISFFWIFYSKKQERKFIIPLFISVIHYFSLASFLGLLFVTWLVRSPLKLKVNSPNKYNLLGTKRISFFK
jgi:hypothetical protein